MGVSSLLTELLWEALGAAKEGVRQTESGIWLTTTWDSTQQLTRVCVLRAWWALAKVKTEQ